MNILDIIPEDNELAEELAEDVEFYPEMMVPEGDGDDYSHVQ